MLGDDVRDVDERVVAIAGRELGLVRRFDPVVEFVAHPVAQLVDDGPNVQSLQRERREQAVEDLDVVEVGADGAVDTGVLHLDRDITPVAEHGAVHLPDRRGGDGLRIPAGEPALRRLAQLVAHDPLGELRCHRWRVGLQCGERLLGLLRQALEDEPEQLADLHERALHLAHGGRGVLGRPDGEAGVELGALLLR